VGLDILSVDLISSAPILARQGQEIEDGAPEQHVLTSIRVAIARRATHSSGGSHARAAIPSSRAWTYRDRRRKLNLLADRFA